MATNSFFRLSGGRMVPDVSFDATLIPSSDEKDALAGSQGSPGSANVFVTETDPVLPSSDEKAALAGPGGYTPSASDVFGTESFIRALIDGLDWQESITHGIEYTKAGTPIGVGAASGEKCLDTTNKKLHTFTAAWDAGVAITSLRFCHYTTGTDTGGDAGTHTASNDIYRADASDNITTVSPDKGTACLFEDDDTRRQFNGTIWVNFDSGSTHNTLGGLQGGDGSTEYYHMTSAENDALAGAADALSSSNPVLGKGDKARVPTRYSFIYRGGVGQSQTDVKMFDDNDQRANGVVMHKAGFVVGIVLQSSAACTAGQLDAEPHKNGTDVTDASLDISLESVTNPSDHYANAAEGVSGLGFSAGDKIGVHLTSNGTWVAGGSEDLSADLLVVFS